ncbi:pyocin activator PrtN family protein [Vibrio vulnificus]|uniref:pyocin activator PrtN family protein n=2 Tax=Vibrionaceae TaxID=641 RepID=UPI001028C25F|nr:hypothetical protein [Vibrio vulnificus]EIO3908886.1 pyocin activator PrtN family protein [Vibrio vulnificus]EJC6737452.1 pyocin activator PrtN family protein [Vibrio vulnificus]ELS0763338.1 pyocin activator PrtN family protein [Vibrio vulnificus]ELV8608209.1 pyocin activator PrtN family protein [Vibrio vulnificus]
MKAAPITIPMTTHKLLAEQFNNKPLIPLEELAELYLGLTPSTAKRKARDNLLPFPVMRLGDSQKSPWVVSFEHFARYVDQQAAQAHESWKRLQC